jgi:putative hydrolase of HD superfamily
MNTEQGNMREMQQIVDFILEIDQLKAVTRKVRPVGLDRYENSAEHSWQIALFAAALVPYADRPLDLDRVIRMLLVHDLGEIDTGDTIVFAHEGWQERKSAERVAVERIFGMLPKSSGEAFLGLWDEFEVAETVEARFAHAVDRAMPVLLNLNNQGGSWKEHGISYARVVERVGPEIEAGCPALWRYLELRLVEAHEKAWFGDELPNVQKPS